MPIVPDVKDWTWVLERPCPECGFDATATAYESVPALTRDAADRFAAVLDRPGVRARPDESTWSALEYGAHVRDVCRLFDTRLALMLAGAPEDEPPRFANWDQDETAVADRYNEQDPARVAAELDEAAERVARSFASVPPERRGLRGARSDGALFTVESFARYFVHDLVHHVHDVRG
ncbi:DinB family protein [Nocardia abscessus]|uniref:DinB family protein n=1 Tax=Nocardia TaxID=1817 RepID=UPI001893C5A3|nr:MULTISPECIES: DinB family protein [Nocardia]MBF6219335.1 DinB family protein [Nocardia abscessus]MDE1669229.1 DinB family protein [Nocardia gipuzkoensis]